MLSLEPGYLFGGRYQILKAIGAGGMGAVYLAQDPRYQDFLVALKVLYPGVVKTKEARERFRNEIVASYRVNHPNIVRAYEYFDTEDYQAYSMEYIDGGDLLAQMKRGAFDTDKVVDVLKQAAYGLAAIHAQGIVHRDLKPENILITNDGVVKITDFGVARLRGASNLTQEGAMVGTPKYLAPEYIETGECDHRGDLYALGVIGYELLTGASPFKSDSKVSLMVERLKVEIPPLREVAPRCPNALAKVIEKALSVNIHKRHQSAEELIKDLESLERGEDPLPDTVADSTSDLKRRLSGMFEREPAIYGLPGSQALYIKRSSRWQNWIYSRALGPALIGISLLFGVLLSAYLVPKLFSGFSLYSLQPGTYEGATLGLLGEESNYPLRIWINRSNAYALIGKSHCSISPVDRNGEFNCGDLRFKLSIRNAEDTNAVGTIEEIGWGTRGTFSISRTEAR